MTTPIDHVNEPVMPRPDFIYFDLGNVLANFSHERGCRQIAALAGLSWERVWAVLFDGNLEETFERGALSPDEFFSEFCRLTNTRPPLDDFIRASSAIFELNQFVAPVFSQLQVAGFDLGILSNTNIHHWNYCLQHYGSLGSFTGICALSYQLRSMKPERLIYEKAAEMCGREPAKIFFVDDRKENVAGAVDAGFDAVLFHNAAQLVRDLYQRDVQFNL